MLNISHSPCHYRVRSGQNTHRRDVLLIILYVQKCDVYGFVCGIREGIVNGWPPFSIYTQSPEPGTVSLCCEPPTPPPPRHLRSLQDVWVAAGRQSSRLPLIARGRRCTSALEDLRNLMTVFTGVRNPGPDPPCCLLSDPWTTAADHAERPSPLHGERPGSRIFCMWWVVRCLDLLARLELGNPP